MKEPSADIDRHVRAYLAVWTALLALTLATVGVSYLRLPAAEAIAAALAIAAVKGSLVAAIFMHLRWEGRLLLGLVAGVGLLVAVVVLVPYWNHLDAAGL